MNLGLLALATVCVSCASGGGLVTADSGLNPTPAPVGGGTTPTPTPVGATPSPTPVGATPSPTPVGATPSPTPVGATPTPSPTPTSVGGSCTTSSAAASSQTYTLNGSAQTINLPVYNVFSGTAGIPSQSPSGTVLTLKDSQNNFDSAPTSTSSDAGYGARTKIFFASASLSQTTTFGAAGTQPLIPITLNSPCIVAGTTYFVDEFALGSFQYSEADTATVNGSVTGNIKVTVNGFPGGVTADFIFSH